MLGGLQTYQRIERSGHRLRVIFTSGYSGDTLSPELLESRSIRILAKPYRPDTLLQTIREVLQEPPPR
jgi:DNA-binding NtrC family response regulator